MTARGYELDDALRDVLTRLREMDIRINRNRPSTGSSYSGTGSGSASTNVQDAIDELFALVGSGAAVDVSITDAGGYFTGTNVEAALQELAAKAIGHLPHGALGAAATFDAAVGWHSGTFDAACTFTLTGALPAGTVSSLFLELAQNGTGGWAMTLPASVVNRVALEAAQDTTAGTTSFLVLLSRDGGTTWVGGWWGGSAGTPATTVTDETTFGITPAVGTDTEYARQDHTHGSPANPVTAAAVEAAGRWERVTDPGSSAPPVDTYSPDGTEFVYSFVPV